jgi:hypothetical protein
LISDSVSIWRLIAEHDEEQQIVRWRALLKKDSKIMWKTREDDIKELASRLTAETRARLFAKDKRSSRSS